MGAYYDYVNITKKERFSVDSLGGGVKHYALGRTLAARALHLMLEYRKGRWARDNIAIVGDDVAKWWDVYEEFVDIEANAILTVFRMDGFEDIRESAADDKCFLMQLCHMVLNGQAPEMEHDLQEMCGGDIQQRYAELWELNRHFRPKDVVPRHG